MIVRLSLLRQICVLPTILFAFALNSVAGDSTMWGPISAGLRLGLSVDGTGNDLLAILQNTSSTTLIVLVGMRSGSGAAYNLVLIAKGQNGRDYKVWDLRPESLMPVEGLVLPEVVTLPPAAT